MAASPPMGAFSRDSILLSKKRGILPCIKGCVCVLISGVCFNWKHKMNNKPKSSNS